MIYPYTLRSILPVARILFLALLAILVTGCAGPDAPSRPSFLPSSASTLPPPDPLLRKGGGTVPSSRRPADLRFLGSSDLHPLPPSPRPLVPQSSFAFLPNEGQWNARALYRLDHAGMRLWFAKQETVIELDGHILRHRFLGADD